MTNGTSGYWAPYRFPEAAPLHERRTFGLEDLKPGWAVYDVDGDQIGRIRDIGDFLVVSRGLLERDLHLPWSAVRLVAMHRVELNIDIQEAKRHGWDRPPRIRANASLD